MLGHPKIKRDSSEETGINSLASHIEKQERKCPDCDLLMMRARKGFYCMGCNSIKLKSKSRSF